jgi:FtsP/CotA-like multicopper oxidase with cupredoxin domain
LLEISSFRPFPTLRLGKIHAADWCGRINDRLTLRDKLLVSKENYLMYPIIYGVDALCSIVILILWWIAGSKAGRLQNCKTQKRWKRQVRRVIILIAVSMLFVIGKIVAAEQLYVKFGWVFAQDRLLIHLPLLLIAVISVSILAIPRLISLSRTSIENEDASLETTHYRMAAAPQLIVPLKAATFTAMTVLYFFFIPQVPFLWKEVTIPNSVLIVIIALTGLRYHRRSKTIHNLDSWKPRRKSVRILRGTAGFLVVVLGISVCFSYVMEASRIPEKLSMMNGTADYGNGIEGEHQHAHGSGVISVVDLNGKEAGEPDSRFTLTAEKKTIQLSSGKKLDAWTYNGQIPGPELRMKQGELIEVTLINKDITEGATIHWHGLDVPNAEDGVAGITQNAVMPGETYTYRFRAEQIGSFWYHSHQDSAEAVKKGLFGALIVEDPNKPPAEKDIIVLPHMWEDGSLTFGASAKIEQTQMEPGTLVRLRLYNTDNWVLRKYAIVGVPFQVAAIDGTELNGPTNLKNTHLEVTTGGRYDVTFIMPETPVFLSVGGDSKTGILFSQKGKEEVPSIPKGSSLFDPAAYGTPLATPFDANSHFDREFHMILDNEFSFFNGSFGGLFTINGEVFPNTPMYMVKEGDLVKTTIVNRGMVEHPMHLHGHHMLVLSRNGKAVSGSPWWSDTLQVLPGETYEVAFIADNPGIWMDHCHNLDHAVVGMTLHLAYEGITTPFEVGTATNNHPE